MSEEDSSFPIGGASEKLKFRVEEAILILLLILSLLGVVLTNFSPADGWWYWMIMIFIFGFAAIVVGFFKAKERSHLVKDLLIIQTVHWSGSMAAVVAAFSLLQAKVLNEHATGLVILLILALATFLDGIRLGWRFSMVGAFLGIAAVIVAHVEYFMPLIILLAVVIVALTIYWEIRRTKKLSSF